MTHKTPCCVFLHGSDYKCLLSVCMPGSTCPERLKGNNCRLVKEMASDDEEDSFSVEVSHLHFKR